MKITLIKYLFCLFIGTSLFSCQKDKSQELIREAQNSLMIGQPDVALNLLASIQNLESLDEYNYMKYVVTHIGAKYEAKEDIKADTLILKAQKYFSKKGNAHDQTLANFYAAQFYNINDDLPTALEYYIYTISQANKSNNHLIAGRSLNNIGYIYYEQGLLDNAIINYQKALFHYEKVENIDTKKLRTLTYIASSYDASNKLDSAFFYFDKCLMLAKKNKNEEYQFYSLKNMGVVLYCMEKYEIAIEYFQAAIAMGINDQLERSKAHLYLLRIYNKKEELNLAKQYVDLIKRSLPSITYNHTVKEIYAALAEYYKQSGDYKQALQYSDLESETMEQIQKEKQIPKLLAVDKNVHISQKKKEIDKLLKYKQYTRYIEELF